ncbi:MAG: hypothetical protein ACI9WU_000501 [Myxococcota bacterium]|jgi:hypothetical protein
MSDPTDPTDENASTPQPEAPVMRIRLGAEEADVSAVVFTARSAEGRVAEAIAPGRYPALWTGPGQILFQVEVKRCSLGPDRGLLAQLKLHRIGSFEGAEALKTFLLNHLKLDQPPEPTQQGKAWWHTVAAAPSPLVKPLKAAPSTRVGAPPSGAEPTLAGATSQPLRVSGHQPAAAALETGRPPTTVEGLREWLQASGDGIGRYINAPCCYLVGGSPYWGRATRINDRFLHFSTANVVPGLGVRIRCDLTLDIGGVKRPVAIHGIVTQKKDAQRAAMYKASLAVRINGIDEGISPGLLLEYLQLSSRSNEPDEPGCD